MRMTPSPDAPVTDFEPIPMHTVESPEQLKAFTDPLRNQILAILAERPATNQQVADQLGEPQAKVLYHIRVLLQEGLIKLVGTVVKGGNVEKYYRAIAKLFALRPGPEMFPAIINNSLELIRQEVAASVAHWPDQPRWLETRSKHITPEQLVKFQAKIREVISRHWDALEEDPSAPLVGLVALTYRDPNDPTARAEKPKRARRKTG